MFLSVFVVRRELLYVSTSFRICQELFSSFIKFFCAVLRSGRFRRSSHNSIKIPHIISFVKNFFRFLQISLCFLLFCAVLPDSLAIIPPERSFVKHYFQIFSKSKLLFIRIQFRPICAHLYFRGTHFSAPTHYC